MSGNILEQFRSLPGNLANHLMLTVIALAVGVLVSVPLAVWLSRSKKARYPVLATAGVIQTIPSLALLALMVPLLDYVNRLANRAVSDVPFDHIPRDERVELLAAFGFWPAVIALTLYSILPILRNTVTGILGVDAAMTEAARGVGMTPRQVLWKVELPLAAPVIIAGIRTATVWVVGIATLATPVGQRCLGNYIFAGLQTRNWTAVMFGVVAAAVLALLLDGLIGGLQKAAEQRRRALGAATGASLAAVIVLGLAAPSIVQLFRAAPQQRLEAAHDAPDDDRARRRVIRIGSKTFTEQYILAALIDAALTDAGMQTQRTESLGSTIVFDALAGGDLDVYVDYSGTIWANYMNEQGTAAPWDVLAQMSGWLAREHGIRHLGSLGFENAYALAMRREQAEQLGIKTIADLAAHIGRAESAGGGGMKIGGDYEFFNRPEWRAIRDGYGLSFDDQISYDSTLMYRAVADGQVDVISAFSSDGRIAAFGLVVLEDPRQVIPPYDAVLLLGPSVAEDEGVVKALQSLIGAIDTNLMQRANAKVDIDGQTPTEAAQWLRQQVDAE